MFPEKVLAQNPNKHASHFGALQAMLKDSSFCIHLLQSMHVQSSWWHHLYLHSRRWILLVEHQ